MPFSKDMVPLVGRKLAVEPKFGYGWRLTGEGEKLITEIAVPGPFRAELTDVLFDDAVALALIGKLDLDIKGQHFSWGYFVPRTASIIDLRECSVGCNVLLSESKPYLSKEAKFPDPKHVCTESKIQLRGSGQVSLSDF